MSSPLGAAYGGAGLGNIRGWRYIAGVRRFNLEELALLRRCLERSEGLVAASFRIPALPSKQYPYEVATLGELSEAERAEEAFAHLVVYERQRARGEERLYRICLQDGTILARLSDGGPSWLAALLVYVLTHELVHVVRFQRAEQTYAAAGAERDREEDLVHRLTLELLAEAREPEWQSLNERYGNPVIPALRLSAPPPASGGTPNA